MSIMRTPCRIVYTFRFSSVLDGLEESWGGNARGEKVEGGCHWHEGWNCFLMLNSSSELQLLVGLIPSWLLYTNNESRRRND